MRRFHYATALAAASAALFFGPARADDLTPRVDPAVVGSEWVGGSVGASKRPGERPEIKSSDAKLVITERDGEKFAGIIAFKNGEKRAEVRGTIKPAGTMQFILTKDLSGGANDVIGLVKVRGKLKDERMDLSFQGTIGTKRVGAIGLELKKPDAEVE